MSFLNRQIHRLWYAAYRLRSWRNARRGYAHRLDVAPGQIASTIGHTFEKWSHMGRFVGGSWDLAKRPFETTDTWTGLQAHFVDGFAWPDTVLYQRAVQQIAAGQVKWACRSEAELAARFADLDATFEDMKAHGYRDQYDLGQLPGYQRHTGEILVCIGRAGELIIQDGRHRLSMARILELDRIPVQVLVRHREWHRERQRRLAGGGAGDEHPDLTARGSR